MGREGKKDGEKGVSAKAKHTHSTVRLKMGNDEHYVKWINNITVKTLITSPKTLLLAVMDVRLVSSLRLCLLHCVTQLLHSCNNNSSVSLLLPAVSLSCLCCWPSSHISSWLFFLLGEKRCNKEMNFTPLTEQSFCAKLTVLISATYLNCSSIWLFFSLRP